MDVPVKTYEERLRGKAHTEFDVNDLKETCALILGLEGFKAECISMLKRDKINDEIRTDTIFLDVIDGTEAKCEWVDYFKPKIVNITGSYKGKAPVICVIAEVYNAFTRCSLNVLSPNTAVSMELERDMHNACLERLVAFVKDNCREIEDKVTERISQDADEYISTITARVKGCVARMQYYYVPMGEGYQRREVDDGYVPCSRDTHLGEVMDIVIGDGNCYGYYFGEPAYYETVGAALFDDLESEIDDLYKGVIDDFLWDAEPHLSSDTRNEVISRCADMYAGYMPIDDLLTFLDISNMPLSEVMPSDWGIADESDWEEFAPPVWEEYGGEWGWY